MKIHLTAPTHDFISEVTRRCMGEVGGMGYCHVEDSTIVVTDAFLLPQEVSTGSVEFDHDAIAIAVERAALADRIEELRFSWHSHGKLATFWSGTDDDAIETYLAGGTPWLVSLVVNRDGQMLGRVDVANVPIAGVAQFNKVTVTADHTDPTNGRAQGEIDAYVRELIRPVRRKWAQPRRLHELTDGEWEKDDFLDSLGGVFTG